MKPDPAIYRLVLEKIGFKARETVFIDDFIENVEEARGVGMEAIHFKNREQACKELEVLLNGG